MTARPLSPQEGPRSRSPQLVNAEHYGASVREVADDTKNADSAGLNRFPIRPATFARSAAHAQ